MGADFWIVVRWWGTLFLVGAVAFPLTKKLFPTWYDRGYLFAKAVGLAIVTYIVYLLAMAHVVPFIIESIIGALVVTFLLGVVWYIIVGSRQEGATHAVKRMLPIGITILIEEIFFFIALLFWSWVKGHEASIHGLEKFMDYGFMQSIYNSWYFPAPDMWYAGYPINYYYFGHTVVALLSKLSGVSLVYAFNLMLATIFAFCLTMSFSIGKQISKIGRIGRIGQICAGVLTAFLVTMAGNMQTLYAFTKGYTGEDVKPFWQLLWSLNEIRSKLPEGLERYWYANATRFIPFTIHEFPSYSFVVSDVHGHVMSIPFVLLAIAFLIQMFGEKVKVNGKRGVLIFYGILVAVLLMTNALDGPIYLGLFLVLFMITNWSNMTNWTNWIRVGVVTGVAVLASIPFMSKFSSFVSGVALNCPPAFLANRKVGPLLFEGVEKCQHSPFWMVWLLWGFFIYCGVWLVASLYQRARASKGKIQPIETLLIVFFFVSIALIIFPEFFYFKDIYPAHFRSNTMFKLGYQAFIMFSIVSGYVIVSMIQRARASTFARRIFLILLIPQLFFVSIYPIFSVRSYFNSLRTYKGLDGLAWLADSYPEDYAAIMWLRDDASTHRRIDASAPIIVEADGDSYTDHARFSAFTGFPAIIGWPVHEWLWRGTYDVVAPRREEVRVIYESEDRDATRVILEKYGVRYIIVGGMERTKFSAIAINKLEEMATVVFSRGATSIYRIK